MLGNNRIKIKIKTKWIVAMWGGAIFLQILEGYWYFIMGSTNYGTQLKLTAILSGSLFCLMAFRYIETESSRVLKTLVVIGNYSFGIYFSHLTIKTLLSWIPGYTHYVIYPFDAFIIYYLSVF